VLGTNHSTILLLSIGKDAHLRESESYHGHRNVNLPSRQHPNPIILEDVHVRKAWRNMYGILWCSLSN